MIVELGHYALIVALATALLSSVLPIIGARRLDEGLMAFAPVAAVTCSLFVADTVLAKHDETYMPREVADSLKEMGVWQGSEQ